MSEDSLARAAEAIRELPRDRRVLVAIDGVDGAGKTTFADRLAPRLDRPVVRASEDDFLNPAAIRHRRGRGSPEGFFRDTYDLALLGLLLLDPFAAGRPFRRRAFDVLADAPVVSVDEHAPAGALLLLDGMFLHRDELLGRWDLSILLDVPPEVAAERLLAREGKPTRPRYVLGQRRYFAAGDPSSRASLVLAW